MEIDITSLVTGKVDMWPLSGSIVTHGVSAGPATWAASMKQAKETPILDTEEKLDALRDYMRGFGAWDDAAIAAWSDDECNAMFLQHVAGDLREMGIDGEGEIGTEEWAGIEADQQAGRIAANIFRGDDGRFFFYLGS